MKFPRQRGIAQAWVGLGITPLRVTKNHVALYKNITIIEPLKYILYFGTQIIGK